MQPDLYSWRAAETTSGPRPASAVRAKKPATPPDYTAQWLAFVATDSGHAIASALLATARARLARGDRRISVRALLADVRTVVPLLSGPRSVVAISHNWTAPASDWLITMDPRLGDVIERRKRTAALAVTP